MFDGVPLDRRLRINPNLRLIFVTRNEVLVKHGTRSAFSKIFGDHANSGLIGPLVARFREPTSLSEIFDRDEHLRDRRDDVLSLVETLIEDGVLVDAQDGIAASYYRALRGAANGLSDKHVGIVGAGQVGARVARHLAWLGVGKLTILDDGPLPDEDEVRRLFGCESTVGDDKGETLAGRLAEGLRRSGHPDVSVLADDRIDVSECEEIFSVCDFVVAAFDEYRLRILHTMNQAALDADKPWISLYIDGSEAVIGPLFVPGETCCFNEFFQQGLAAAGLLKKEVMAHLDALDSQGTRSLGIVLPFFADIAAGYLVSGVADYLMTERSFLVGRAIRQDFERLAIDYEEILRLPRCPACRPFRPFRHVSF